MYSDNNFNAKDVSEVVKVSTYLFVLLKNVALQSIRC